MTNNKQAVHVVTTTREYKGKVYKAHLLRHSYREDGKVKNETIANLSVLPEAAIEGLRRLLKGETLVSPNELFETVSSRSHGAVQAVLTAMQRLGFANLLASRPCRERDLVVAMVAARILEPHSKLATTRWWGTTTLAEALDVVDATETELYAAMDWLYARQDKIEKRLVARHFEEGSQALYDLSSSYVEGTKCPLATYGYSRDGKKNTLQIVYGLVTNAQGCPMGISVYPGNRVDCTTLTEQIGIFREVYGVQQLTIVGDRGTISQKQIDAIRDDEDLRWVTGLKSVQVRPLLRAGAIQLSFFDERNLFEFTHPSYPGERLIACRNPLLAAERKKTRADLIADTTKELKKLQRRVERGTLVGRTDIGWEVGSVIDARKMAKYFLVTITDTELSWTMREDRLAEAAEMDGIYVIRTNLSETSTSTHEAVLTYKRLAQVERAFRTLKGIDLQIRPIYHHLADRVSAHVFLCMLAYYVEWHMREAWRELLFADEDQEAKATRDPVAPAQRSEAAKQKAQTRQRADGSAPHSFGTLMADLATIVRNECRRKDAAATEPSFPMTTQPTPQQRRALDLLEAIAV